MHCLWWRNMFHSAESSVDINHSPSGVNMEISGRAFRHWLELFILSMRGAGGRVTQLLCSPRFGGFENSIFSPPLPTRALLPLMLEGRLLQNDMCPLVGDNHYLIEALSLPRVSRKREGYLVHSRYPMIWRYSTTSMGVDTGDASSASAHYTLGENTTSIIIHIPVLENHLVFHLWVSFTLALLPHSSYFWYHMCEGLSPHQAVMCDTSWVSYNLTHFWHSIWRQCQICQVKGWVPQDRLPLQMLIAGPGYHLSF